MSYAANIKDLLGYKEGAHNKAKEIEEALLLWAHSACYRASNNEPSKVNFDHLCAEIRRVCK